MASQEKSYETMSKWGSSVQRRILVEDTNSNFNCMLQRGDKDPWGQVSSVPIPVTVHYKLLKTLDINLITNFRRPPFTVTSIWVELLRPSYFELAVPNDPRRSSPPDAKVEVAVSNVKSVATYSNFNFKFHQGQGSLGTTTICPHDLSLSNIHYSTS
jgi:hypothetical protein